MSSSHTDGTGGVTRTYGILGNPYQTKTGNTVNAQYTYLSDGTRIKAVDSSGSGYAYRGSSVYNVSVNGETLESVAFGGGRIEKNGTGYEVAYHITDHLGSVRSIVKNGTIVEQNDYYPFGGRLADSALSQQSSPFANRWRFSGKEDLYSALGDPVLDFGARMYSTTGAMWQTQDPMAEKYYGISPFVYCVDNPLGIVDPEGFDIYRYDDKSGEMILIEENNDEFDQVGRFKYDRKTGEYTLRTRKDGTARTRINHIEKGILNPNGMDFFRDNYISLQGDSHPSIAGVQKFLLDFSNMIDREVGGYYVSGKGQDGIQYITIGSIRNNTANNAIPGNPFRVLSDLPGFKIDNYDVSLNYHTHLSRFSDYDRLYPSSLGPDGGDIGFKKRQLAKSPTMKFLIITNPTPFYF